MSIENPDTLFEIAARHGIANTTARMLKVNTGRIVAATILAEDLDKAAKYATILGEIAEMMDGDNERLLGARDVLAEWVRLRQGDAA